MFNFKKYLEERNLSGAPGTEGKGRGISHIISYLGPYMSAEDREKTIQGFNGRISRTDLPDKDGDKHHPENTSHELGSSFEDYKAGEKIKVTHSTLDKNTGKMMVHTRDHGIIPASKIKINDEDKREKKTQGGLDNEKILSSNFGVTSSEGAANAPDFYWDGEDETGKSEVKGKIRHKTDEKPLVVGEAKRNSGSRMGVANLKMDKKTGAWAFSSKSDPKIIKSMMNAKVPGEDGVERNVLDHYNHHYRGQEVVPAGTVSAKGTGVAKTYLNRYNALHIHRTEGKIDHGTSYTMNNFPHAGKTNVSHLSDEDIDDLEGKIAFEKTNSGSVRLTHTPNSTKFNELAARSTVDPKNNVSFMNKEHVNTFKNMVRSRISVAPQASSSTTQKIQTSRGSSEDTDRFANEGGGGAIGNKNRERIEQGATSSHGGMPYHSPNEQEHIRGSV
jgi:hypothetical protein